MKERERERETDRQTDRDNERERESDRQTDREGWRELLPPNRKPDLNPFSLMILLSIVSSFLTSSKEKILPSQQFRMKVTKLSTSSLKKARYLLYSVSSNTLARLLVS